MRFYFPGEPRSLSRPRFGKFGKAYNSQKETMAQDKTHALSEMARQNALQIAEAPISVSLVFLHQIPKSWSQRRRIKAAGTFYKGSKDIDNCLKYYLDVLTGCAYKDDKQVVYVVAHQIYSSRPGVDIHVNEMKKEQFELDKDALQYDLDRASGRHKQYFDIDYSKYEEFRNQVHDEE